MIDPKTFATSTLQLLQDDPRRYRLFGAYWYLVKALLNKFYTRDNLALLGDNIDPAVAERIPHHENLQEALEGAIAEYRKNAQFNMGSNDVEDLVGGGTFALVDPDAGGL